MTDRRPPDPPPDPAIEPGQGDQPGQRDQPGQGDRPGPAAHRAWGAQGIIAEARAAEALCPTAAQPFVLAATIVGSSLAFIDGTIVYLALPSIQGSLDASFGQLQWIVNIYTLLLGALVLVGGALGDRFGRRLVFMIGLVTFTLASLACGLARDAPTMLAARAVQGLGAALVVPQSLAIIAATFPREQRSRAIASWAAWAALTTALGPGLGGTIIETLSWRAAFLINLPLGAIALVTTLRFMPESRLPRGRSRIDLRGAVLVVGGLGVLTYALTAMPRSGLASAEVLIGGGVALAILALFVATERRSSAPIIPPDLLRIRAFVVANIVTLLLYFTLGGVLFLLPYALIEARGVDAATIGLAMMPLGLIIGLWSKVAGHLGDRFGERLLLTIGPLIVAVACIGFAWPVIGTGIWAHAVLPIIVMAVGLAFTVAPLTSVVMISVPEFRSGIASGINNSVSRLAGLAAVALLGSLMVATFEGRLSDLAAEQGLGQAARETLGRAAHTLSRPDPAADPSAALRQVWSTAFFDAFEWAMAVAAAMAVASAACAWFGLSRSPPVGAGRTGRRGAGPSPPR